MKKFNQIFYLLFLIITVSCTEDLLEPETQMDTFIKFYGEKYPMQAVDAKLHPDGGVVLLATAEAEIEEGVTFYPVLIKIDKYGNQEWIQINERGPEANIRPNSLYLGQNDQYYIAGDDRRENDGITTSYMYILGMSSTSPETFYFTSADDREINNPADNGQNGNGRAVTQLSNGNLLLVGEATNGLLKRSLVYELDATSGDIVWKRFFDDTKTSITNSIYEHPTGRVYWAGANSNGEKAEVMGVVPGNISEVKYLLPNSNEVFDIKSTDFNNNEFLFLGDEVAGQTTNMRLISSSRSGNVNVNTSIQGSALLNGNNETFNVEAKSVAFSPTGGYLALGEADIRGGDFFLTEYDGDGNEKPDRLKLYGSGNAETPVKVLSLADGIMMFGHTNFADVNILMVIKTDIDGNLN